MGYRLVNSHNLKKSA